MSNKWINMALVAALAGSTALAYVKLKGVDTAAMNTQADPKEDFYEYANGNWLKNNPVPATESRWSSFNILEEQSITTLHKILQDAAADKTAAPGTVRRKVGDFYKSFMDSASIEKNGLNTLKPYISSVLTIKNTDELIRLVASHHAQGIGPLFGFSVFQDIKNSSAYAPYIGQGGIGLPDRDYYLKEDEKSVEIRKEYLAHVKKIFELSGVKSDAASKYAEKVMALETELAKVSMTRVELRNIEKQYNKKSYAQLKAEYPNLAWDTYFKGLSLNPPADIIVMQPEFMAWLNTGIKTQALEDWKIYLHWHLLHGTASRLGQGFVDENFRFYATVLTGTKEQKPRWKKAVNVANELVGEMVAQEYVKVAFSPESKKRVNEMVDNLIAAFRIRLSKLDWMTEPTRQKALEKLAAFNRKLGYPDKWTDYSSLSIVPDNYLQNYFNAARFSFRYQVNKLGKPVDKSEWEMLPQQVNAYYTPLLNEVVFPAAIMQPPFFDANADDAVNYGGIGAVIGHELLHGFDDQGSQFTADGNLQNWWTETDKQKFEERTKQLAAQFSRYVAVDDVHVNGELTLGENIADLGGLTIAYEALQLYYQQHERKTIDGFTPEQRFYIGWAQVWKNNIRPEALRQQVLTDPHSPGKFRVLGPLSNLHSFYEAFGVKPGNAMYRPEAERVVIW